MLAILRRPPTETDSWAAVGVLVGRGVGVATTVASTGCNDGIGGAEAVAAGGCVAGSDDSPDASSSAAPPQPTTINVRAETAVIRKPFDFNIFVPSVRKSKCALSAPIDSEQANKLDFVHLGGAGEDVGELSVNCGWGFSTVGVQPRQLNSSVGQPQHEVRRFGHVSKFCAKSR